MKAAGRYTARMRILIAALLALPTVAFAAATLQGPIQGKVIQVIDGAKIEVRAEIWLDKYIETTVKLAGLNAPELPGACAREKDLAEKAKARIEKLLKPGVRVRLTAIKEGKIADQVVAVVSFQYLYGQVSLASILIDEGLARRYKSGMRKGWCDDE